MKVRFFDPGLGYQKIKPEIDKAMQDVLARGDLILRKDVEEFEQKLAFFLNVKHAVGVASGTDALILSLRALGVGPGDEVITTSYSFRATVEAIVHVGAEPVLTDLGEDWKKYKTKKTKAIIPTHIAGEFLEWQPDEDVVMIEDACQAIGAESLWGEVACYSFYPAKILGCYGDGGAIVTNDTALYEKLKVLRNHNKGNWDFVGYNSRLDNLQAAVLNVKMKYLTEHIVRRKEVADIYYKELGSLPIKMPTERDVYQDFIIEVENRDALHYFLEKQDVETMKNGYPYPALAEKKPLAVAYEAHSLRLPCNAEITDEQVKYVCEKIKEFYQE